MCCRVYHRRSLASGVLVLILVFCFLSFWHEQGPVSLWNTKSKYGETQTGDRWQNRRLNHVIYKQRYDTQIAACSNVNLTEFQREREETIRNHFFVVRKAKLLFCLLEKVGCTFWKRAIQIITGARNKSNPYDISATSAHTNRLETFHHMPFYEIVDIVSAYRKIIFVRDPYTRLFSAYVDKLFNPNLGYFHMRRRIASITRGNVSFSPRECAPFVTFAEFVKYVINSLKTGKGRDGHFMPMTSHCLPCQLRFDIIAKMETFSTDTEYITESHNLDRYVNISLDQQSVEKDVIFNKINSLYRRLENIKHCMPFSRAIKLVWRGFQIVGIIPKDQKLPQQFLEDTNLGADDFKSAVLKVYEQSDTESKKVNRKEALVEAYRSVPERDLAEFRRLFRSDFDVFGYSIYRSDLFGNSSKSRFSYLTVD